MSLPPKRSSETSDDVDLCSKMPRSDDAEIVEDSAFEAPSSTNITHTEPSTSDLQNPDFTEKIIALTCEGNPPVSRIVELLPVRRVQENSPYTELPEARMHACLIAVNNFAYVIGGYINEDPTNTVISLDLESNNPEEEWDGLPPMTISRAHHACAFLNGVIYAAGGRTSHENFATTSGITNSCEQFNLENRVWTSFVSMLEHACGHSLVPFQGGFYVFGGVRHSDMLLKETLSGKIEWFSFRAREWTHKSSIRNGRKHGAAVCFNNNIWLLGGVTRVACEAGQSCYEFDCTTASTKKIKNFNCRRDYTSAVVFQDQIYIAGGTIGRCPTSTERYFGNEWIEDNSLYTRHSAYIYANGLAVAKIPTRPGATA